MTVLACNSDVYESTYRVLGYKKCIFLSTMPMDWPTGRSSMAIVPTETVLNEKEHFKCGWVWVHKKAAPQACDPISRHKVWWRIHRWYFDHWQYSGHSWKQWNKLGASNSDMISFLPWPPRLYSLETTRGDKNLCCPWQSLRRVVHWVPMC